MPDSSPFTGLRRRWLIGLPFVLIAAILMVMAPKPAHGQEAFSPPHDVSATTYNDYVRVSWQAGTANQYYCIDTAFSQDDLVTLRGSWSNWGCGTTATSFDLTDLACGRLHYFRIWAAGFTTSGYSEVGIFQSQSCNFTAPSNPHTDGVTSSGARLVWTAGNDNYFYCVDFARSQSDLLTLSGSWFNTDCGTTATVADISGLSCDTTYYWRVWATNATTSGYTSITSLHTDACGYGTQPVTINGSATATSPAILTDVRVGAHANDGYDRIVFEFDGVLPDQTQISYQDSVSQCGSGRPVSLQGNGILVVRMTAAQAHANGDSTIDSTTIQGPGGSILQAKQVCDFEGTVTWAIGTDEIAGFEVTTLNNPGRIVIDVRR